MARNDEVTATQVTGLAPAGVLISPGPCAPAEAGISVEAVRTCATARIPLLGICLGHQAIAAAYGAAVVRAPLPVHGKAFPVKHDGRGVLAGPGRGVVVRAPLVTTVAVKNSGGITECRPVIEATRRAT